MNESKRNIFIEKALTVHKGKYSYSSVVYVNSKTKVKITCAAHGVFEQIPNAHLQGQGCPTCARTTNAEKMKAVNKSSYITKAESVHGVGRYDYSLTEYAGSVNKIIVICKYHPSSPFRTTANNHLSGSGCPYCAMEIKTKSICKITKQTIYFYHVRIFNDSDSFEKIGITSNINKRFSNLKKDGFYFSVLDEMKGSVSEIKILEELILDKLEPYRYKINLLKGTNTYGWTECFPCGLITTKLIETMKNETLSASSYDHTP